MIKLTDTEHVCSIHYATCDLNRVAIFLTAQERTSGSELALLSHILDCLNKDGKYTCTHAPYEACVMPSPAMCAFIYDDDPERVFDWVYESTYQEV
jgi:hypothetical protein